MFILQYMVFSKHFRFLLYLILLKKEHGFEISQPIEAGGIYHNGFLIIHKTSSNGVSNITKWHKNYSVCNYIPIGTPQKNLMQFVMNFEMLSKGP